MYLKTGSARVAVVAGILSLPGWCGELLAPSYLMTTVSVQSASSVVQDGPVTVADEGDLIKYGKGNWTVKPGQLQPWNSAMDVREGRLTLDCASSGAAPAVTLPDSIAAKALFWVDAEDPDATHIVNDGGNVSVWYDRREGASPTTPAYMRAHTLNDGKFPLLKTMEDGKKSVYFGRLSSGKCMEWLKTDGTRWATYKASGNIRHVFAVHCISNSLGTIFGSVSAYFSPFAAGSFQTWSSAEPRDTYWFNNSTWSAMTNGRGYLNGERFDGTTTPWQAGRQMLEAIPYWGAEARVNGFFAAPGSTEYCGGDYLCEALVFTEVLSEVERLQVSSYLMRKWMSNNAAAIRKFNAAVGAEFAIDTGVSDFDGKSALTGEGTVYKQGEGTFVYQSYDRADEFAGSVDVQAGKVQLRSPAAILAKDGVRISVTNKIEGPTVTVLNDAGSGNLVKEDSDLLTVNGLPESIKNVSVKAGTLAVRAPVAETAAERYYEVPIQNGDFEEFSANGYFDDLAEGDGVKCIAETPNSSYGWTSLNNGAYAMDFERWTGISQLMDRNTASAWGITHPPSGKCGMIIVGNHEVRSVAFHLEKGSYRFQYAMKGRSSDSKYLGSMLLSQLVKSDDGSIYGATTNRYAYYYGYRYQQVRIDNLTEGDYYFFFKSISGHMVIDDVRLFRVAEEPDMVTWKLPNGDFEDGQKATKASMQTLAADKAVPGWTFIQSPTWTAGKMADVGVSTLLTTNTSSGQGSGVLYNCSRYPQVGSVELVFCRNGAKAESTFRPPAGFYVLQCDMARFGFRSTTSTPTLAAKVTVGGATIELGSLSPTRRMMERMAWAKGFAVDGETDVTLTLESSGMGTKTDSDMRGLLVDDFALVTRTPNELFLYGDCEKTNSVLVSVPASTFGSKDGWARCRMVETKAYSTFGRYPVDGQDCLCIENLSKVYEDVYLPFAGRYRLSFYAHSRIDLPNKLGQYSPNPLGVTVSADGRTINLGTVDTFNSDWVRRTFDFNVPSSGVWRVAIQGLDDSGVKTVYRDSMVDSISLRQIPDTEESAAAMASDAKIRVAAGAQLKLDFKGTNTVKSVRFGGVPAHGVIDAESYPDFVTGEGALTPDPDGMILLFR